MLTELICLRANQQSVNCLMKTMQVNTIGLTAEISTVRSAQSRHQSAQQLPDWRIFARTVDCIFAVYCYNMQYRIFRGAPMALHAGVVDSPDPLTAEHQHHAMVGFFRIMELWGASNAQMQRMLGSPPVRTFYQWKTGRAKRVPEDTLRRIGYVAGIYKALQILYSDPAQADGWVSQPNDCFGGQTPLDRMAAGDVTDLAAVRIYVDAARAPWS